MMQRSLRITFILALVCGTLLLLPAFAMLVAAGLALTGKMQTQANTQIVPALIFSLVLLSLSLVPIAAFFLRKTERGMKLLKIAGWIFLIPAAAFPLALGLPIGSAIMTLLIALTGVWTLVSTRPESQ